MADTKTKTASGTLQMEVVPPAANKKVELDLDDAPFLQKEEEQRQDLPARPASRPPAKPAAPAPDTGAGKKKKLIIIAAAAAALLLVGLAAVWWFFLRAPAVPPPPPVNAPQPQIITVPTQTVPPPPAESLKALDPFWVENKDAQGRSHFLICTFSIVCDDIQAEQEIDRHMLVIRDAIYFYLRSKTFETLLDAKQVEGMKKDIVDTINNYLTRYKAKDVLFESYIGQ